MIPVDQQSFHCVESDEYGDCTRACVASVLGLPLDDVPHFLALAKGESEAYWDQVYNFLELRGLAMIPGVDAEDPRIDAALYVLGSGVSPRNANLFHHVVMRGKAIAHDPHPSRAGLVGAYADWKFDLIVKESP